MPKKEAPKMMKQLCSFPEQIWEGLMKEQTRTGIAIPELVRMFVAERLTDKGLLRLPDAEEEARMKANYQAWQNMDPDSMP